MMECRRVRMLLVALAGCTAAACGVFIGLEELPPIGRGPDGGGDAADDARPNGASDAGADADAQASSAGKLDPAFGDRGVVVVSVPFEKAGGSSLVLDGDEIVLIVSGDDAGKVVAIRCSNAGSCDSAHPVTLPAPPSSMIRAIAVPAPWADPHAAGILVYGVQDKPGSDYENVVHLWRVTRGEPMAVSVLASETLHAPYVRLGTAFAVGASRSVAVDDSAPDEDAGRLNLRAYLPDGAADPSFGRHGLVTFGPTAIHLSPSDALVQEDGRIVVAATAFDDATGFFSLRFENDGGADRSFGQEGGVARSSRLVDVQSLVRLGGGYLLGGREPGGRGALLRLQGDGREDPSYWDARDGGAIYAFEQDDDAGVPAPTNINALGIEPSGTIVVFGSTFGLLTPPVLMLARVSRSGLDPAFGKMGQIVVDEGFIAQHASMALQADRKVVITWVSGDGFVKVARYLLE
ncbi:hypothetical protein LVJ94_44175 [Pendulispora rubella]|uniref:Uncharacterized protein n=1 Tax=Pendulispora rubella TaxID=2741070 RepID=A0ABZ2KYZ3_9BACT